MAGVAAPRELFAAISPLNTKGVAVNRVRLACWRAESSGRIAESRLMDQ